MQKFTAFHTAILLAVAANFITVTFCMVEVDTKGANAFKIQVVRMLNVPSRTLNDEEATKFAIDQASVLMKSVDAEDQTKEEFKEGITTLDDGSKVLQIRFSCSDWDSSKKQHLVNEHKDNITTITSNGARRGVACFRHKSSVNEIYFIYVSLVTKTEKPANTADGNLLTPNSEVNIPPIKTVSSINNSATANNTVLQNKTPGVDPNDRVKAVNGCVVQCLEEILNPNKSGKVTIEKITDEKKIAEAMRSVKEKKTTTSFFNFAVGYIISAKGTNPVLTKMNLTLGNFKAWGNFKGDVLSDDEFLKLHSKYPDEVASAHILDVLKSQNNMNKLIASVFGNKKKVQYAFGAVGIKIPEEKDASILFAIFLDG